MSDEEREIRAFEAIIVSQLLRNRDPMNLNDLPELTKEQKAKMDSLPANFIEQLWKQADAEEEAADETLCEVTEDEEEFVGMNRAEDMDDETRKELEQARKEVREAMRKERKDGDGANG